MSKRIRLFKLGMLSCAIVLLLLFPILQQYFLHFTFFSDIDRSFSFSHENGFYTDSLQVSLSLNHPLYRHLKIYYTLDGSIPDASSPEYHSALFFPAGEETVPVIIKAVAADSQGVIVGGPYTATYFIGKNARQFSNALVVSITSEEDGLFSPENGILYPMQDCGPTEADWSWFKRQNCKQRGPEWIRNAHIDIFEPDGSNIVSQNIGLCVDGDHGSMTHYPYSLKILADKDYDKNHPFFDYAFFSYYNTKGTDFPHIQKFNNMVFRNGGNEYNAGIKDPEQKGTMLRWNIGSRLADECGFMSGAARPAIIYLNGELYGAAQLQDSYNPYNTASKTGLNKDQIEIFKESERVCTELAGYQELYYSYPEIENTPLLIPENREQLEQLVSFRDMFSYYAFEALVNNTDFPKKNYAIWRYMGAADPSLPSYADGKFRFLINDLDCTYDFRPDDDLWTAYFHNIKENGTLMGSLVQIPAYRAQFVNSLCDLINSGLFDVPHLNAVIDEASNDFNLIASYSYSPADERQRQRNIGLLKENAFARKDVLLGFIKDTFQPVYPYTLSVEAPRPGALIRWNTYELTACEDDFSGKYYGDYPMTLSYEANSSLIFDHWEINSQSFSSPQVTLDKSLIENGSIHVRLITRPSADSSSGLLISEVCADPDNCFVELFNASAEPVRLSDYALANDYPSALKFTLPELFLQPGELFLVRVDNSGVFRIKNGYSLYLTGNGKLADSIFVPHMSATESYGRYSETDIMKYYVSPTPAAVN